MPGDFGSMSLTQSVTEPDETPQSKVVWPGPKSSRICLHSVNFLARNPDALQPRQLQCSCGRRLTIGQDWYTEIYDGTLLCWQCSACARCGIECSVACRRQVSIGGFVLCYDCVKHFGQANVKREPRGAVIQNPKSAKLRAKRTMRTAGDGGGGVETPSAGHNLSSFFCNWWQSKRSPECRRLLRYRDYPRPEHRVPELDPTITPIGFYSATRAPFESMTCPACKSQALGRASYVVPAISMVYHRRCFRCVSCKWSLASGHREAGKHYVLCTCNPPLQWCTRLDCERDRRQHHVTFRCRLEPIHPGGRGQLDTMETDIAAAAADDAPPPAEGQDAQLLEADANTTTATWATSATAAKATTAEKKQKKQQKQPQPQQQPQPQPQKQPQPLKQPQPQKQQNQKPQLRYPQQQLTKEGKLQPAAAAAVEATAATAAAAGSKMANRKK